MRSMKAVLLASLGVLLLAANAEAARGGRGRRDWRQVLDRLKEQEQEARNSEPPVEWMSDFAEARELAGRQDRAMMILFTTEDLMRTSRSCRFATDEIRKAVRERNVVPVRVLPPKPISLRGADKKEARKRRELSERIKKEYRKLVERYGLSTAPALVLAAPDGTKFHTLVVPGDAQIFSWFKRLDGLLDAHLKAHGRKVHAVLPPKKEEGGKPAEKPGESKPAEEIDVDPEEDF